MAASKTPVTDFIASHTPTWLNGPWGNKWVTAIGGAMDYLVSDTKDAVRCRLVMDSPSDALPHIGWERNIDRAPGETDAAYRLRLKDAWETWKWSGTNYGVARSFEAMGWIVLQLTADESWPVGGYSNGHVWVAQTSDFGPVPDLYSAPSPYAAMWSTFWVALDLWSHTTATKGIAWQFGGRKGAGAGTYSSEIHNVDAVRSIARHESSGMLPAAQDPCCAPLDDTRVVVFGGYDGFAASSMCLIWDRNHEDFHFCTSIDLPRQRYSAAMAQEAPGRVVMFGGFDGANKLDDTWTYEAGEWTTHVVAAPVARTSHAMAPLGANVVLFGGVNAAGARLADTWVWDGAAWAEVSPAHSPSARWGHTMVPLSGGVLLFGGNAAAGLSDETWWWDGTDWTQLTALPAGPPVRYLHGAAAISTTECRIWGGFNGSAMLDNWVYSTVSGWRREADLADRFYASATCGQIVRDVSPARGEVGLDRGDGRARGTRLTSAERDTMIASIRKWKGAHSTCPDMLWIKSQGGFGCVRGPFGVRGAGRIRGARLAKCAVGEK